MSLGKWEDFFSLQGEAAKYGGRRKWSDDKEKQQEMRQDLNKNQITRRNQLKSKHFVKNTKGILKVWRVAFIRNVPLTIHV